MATNEVPSAAEALSISGLVPMIHVTDVERSAEFYRLLGFEVGQPRAADRNDGVGMVVCPERL